MTDRTRILELIDQVELAERPKGGRGYWASDSTRTRPVNISLPPDILNRLKSSGMPKSHLIERLIRFYFLLLDTKA